MTKCITGCPNSANSPDGELCYPHYLGKRGGFATSVKPEQSEATKSLPLIPYFETATDNICDLCGMEMTANCNNAGCDNG